MRPAYPGGGRRCHGGRVRTGLLALAAVAVLASCGMPAAWRDAACPTRSDDDLIGADAGTCHITLLPGGSLALPRPAGRALTVSADSAPDPATLTIALSEGTGLLLMTDLAVQNGRVVLPPADDDQIVHLRSPATASAPIRLTLAWPAAQKQPALSRRFVPLAGLAVDVGTSGTAAEPFTLIDASAGATLRIEGPVVLAVRTRPLYDGAADWIRTYRIGVTLDGGNHGVLEYDTSPDPGAASVALPGTGFGIRQTEYLMVPKGVHVIRLDPSQDMLVQIAQSARAATPVLQSGWRLRPADITADGCTAPGQLERVGRRLSRDQARLDGTLASAAGLRALAGTGDGEAGSASLAARFEGAFSFFRDVLPVSPAGLRLKVAYTDLQRSAPGAATADPIGVGLPTDLLLDRLTRAFFVPATGRAQPLVYVPPRRDHPSEIRIIADRAAVSVPVEMFVSYDGGPARRLVVLPVADRDGTPRVSFAALGLGRYPGATADARFAAAREYLPDDGVAAVRLLQGGALRLALPRHVLRVTLWAAPGVEGLPVAVQYRAAPTGGLGPADTLADLRELGRDRARGLFHSAVDTALGCPDWLADPRGCGAVRSLLATAPVAAHEMYNDWLPLLRLLRARERGLFASLPPEDRTGPPVSSGGPALADADAVTKAAQNASQSPVAALARLGVITRSGAPGDWAGAQFAIAGILTAEGDIFLAERVLKNVYLTAADGATRQRAHAALAAFLRQQGATGDLVGLEAAEYRLSPAPHALVHLVDALIADEQPAMAASAALLLPDPGRDRYSGLLAGAGYGSGTGPGPGQHGAGQHGAGAIWQSAEAAIIQTAGGYSYLATARGSFGRFHTARPGVPLRLRVDGPAEVRLRGRPFHPPGADTALDGWLAVRLDQRLWHVPYFGNRPAAGLVTYGTPDRAGTAEEHVIAIPAGSHLIAVEPDSGTIGFDIDISRTPAQSGTKSLAHSGVWSIAAERLADLLYRYDNAASTSAAASAALLAEAAELAHRNSANRSVAALWRGFDRQSGWDRLTTVTASAGTQSIRFAQLPAETPELALRQALLPPLTKGARLVSAGPVTVRVTNARPAMIKAYLGLLALPTTARRSVLVRYQIDNGAMAEIALDAGTPDQEVGIAVPAGPHKIRFELAEKSANAYVSLRVQDASGTTLDASLRRGYDLATRDAPLVLAVRGPVWLRIDEYRDGETRSSYRALPPAAKSVTLLPEPGQEQALLRVFRLQPERALPSRLSSPARTASPPRTAQAERMPMAAPLTADLSVCPAPPAPKPE